MEASADVGSADVQADWQGSLDKLTVSCKTYSPTDMLLSMVPATTLTGFSCNWRLWKALLHKRVS